MRLRDMSASISFLHSTETQRTKKSKILLLFHDMIDHIPPIVEKGFLKGIQVSKRDFSKGFQVRKSKGGNKVRFSVITQKGGIQSRNRLEVF